MPTDIVLADTRNMVLQKIGRNVVKFQRMEAVLKFNGSELPACCKYVLSGRDDA